MKNNGLIAFLALAAVMLIPLTVCSQLKTPESVPITFYGKVIDQNGQPLVGVPVNFGLVTSHIRRLETTSKPMTLKTGADGRFTLFGVKGYAIDGISISVDGYELSQKARRSFVFGLMPDYTPDQSNPVVFKMWKKSGKEALNHSSWHGKVTCDGTTNRFDIDTGKLKADGILSIACLRNPRISPPPGNGRFDYEFKVRLQDGFVQPTTDEFTYMAPEGGYSTEFAFGQKADDPKWNERIPIPKEYYFKTAEGHYGILFVDWYAGQNSPTYLEWNCSINPSGSRNLER